MNQKFEHIINQKLEDEIEVSRKFLKLETDIVNILTVKFKEIGSNDANALRMAMELTTQFIEKIKTQPETVFPSMPKGKTLNNASAYTVLSLLAEKFIAEIVATAEASKRIIDGRKPSSPLN